MTIISIIGAGAAGLACVKALCQNRELYQIELFERNASIAKKIAATGNGHCNLSNQQLIKDAYQGDVEQVISIIKHFNIEKFCNELGFLPRLRGNLYYPYSYQAKTVVQAFDHMIKDSMVNLHFDTEIKKIKKTKNGYLLTDQYQQTYFSDVVVVATGGKAGKGFGTDGAMFKVLEELKLYATPLIPSLVAVNTKENVKKLKGCRVFGSFTLKEDGKKIKTYSGEAIFNENGISGICVMQLSRFLNFYENHQYTLHCNLVDQLSYDDLKRFYESQQASYEGIVPDKIAEYLNYRPTLSLDDFVTRLTNLVFTITSTRDYEQAQVTRGGIPLSYVDENLMVKRYPNLFLCGEVLNIDGDCGGYNLHFAFASGEHVAKAIITKLNEDGEVMYDESF